MIYTGLDKYTDEELMRMAHGSNSRISIELAKRLSELRTRAEYTRRQDDEEAAALRGVDPIPSSNGYEYWR